MKTQILQLEPYDDIISTRDKMGWGQAGRILLVWPRRARILTRHLDLSLLYRRSQALNTQLALVTRDPQVRFHAGRMGIPVFRSIRQAQRSRWRRGRRPLRNLSRQPRAGAVEPEEGEPTLPDLEALRQAAHPPPAAWSQAPVARLAVFSLGVLAVLAIAAVLVPGASLTIEPGLQPQTATFTVEASPAVDTIGLSGTLPVEVLTIVVEGRDRLEATGLTNLPEKNATGLVLFTNLTGEALRVPAGTVVQTPGARPQRFLTTVARTVPAGPVGSTQIPVRAASPGAAGNLPADSLTVPEGSLGLSLSVTNPTPTRGGTDARSPAATAGDRRRLYNQLQSSLFESARLEMDAMTAGGDFVLTPTPTLTAVVEETYEPGEGEPGNFVSLTLRLEYEAMVVRAEDLETLVHAVMDKTLPSGFAPVHASLTIDHLGQPQITAQDGSPYARWRIRARRQNTAQIQTAQAVNLTLGQPPATARQRLLDSLPLAASPEISLSPDWWPRLPVLPFRIQVSLAES